MSPIGPYFQLKSPNNFGPNRSVVDSNHSTWSCYILENIWGSCVLKQLGSRVDIWMPERQLQWYVDRWDFLVILPSHAIRALRSPHARLCFPEIRKKLRLFCRLGLNLPQAFLGSQRIEMQPWRTVKDLSQTNSKKSVHQISSVRKFLWSKGKMHEQQKGIPNKWTSHTFFLYVHCWFS